MRQKGHSRKAFEISPGNEKSEKRVRSSVGVTSQMPVGVYLYQTSSLSPYLVDLIMEALAKVV